MNPEYGQGLAQALFDWLSGEELLFVSYGAEHSDFVRLNRARVRQAGGMQSAGLGLTLIDGGRQIDGSVELSGDADGDRALAADMLARLRERLKHLPEDPYLHFSEQPGSDEHIIRAELPDAREAVASLIDAAEGLDLVGIWASGEQAEGLWSSIGHAYWHQDASFNLDWSCHLSGDKAVKSGYSGREWRPAVLADKLQQQRRELQIMQRPAKALEPGSYRAWLAPAAVAELMDMLAWGGFGLKDHRTQQTPLLKLVRGERTFSPELSLSEAHAEGFSPRFSGEGFWLPERVELIRAGGFGDCLVDARSAKEYGEAVNSAGEAPGSLVVQAGGIPLAEAAARLGEGLMIGNLWYCNWSDPNDCRITGMTRFGTFWVENGEPVASAAVMRFDDSLYHLLGDRLEGLSAERELLLSAETYDGRCSDSALLPGALVSGIRFTL